MKKILLGTTALVGAALFSQAALADAPKITIGGDSQFEAGLVDDKQGGGFTNAANSTTSGLNNKAFYTRNEVSVKVDGKSDAGLGYGAEIWLQADTSGDENSRGVNATRTFIYLDGMWGRVELGSNYGADDTMKVDAGTIARATGGIDGDWRFFANNRAGNPFITTSDLPVNYGAGSTGLTSTFGFGDQQTENDNKITYYTPKWYGLQGGLSYAPNDTRGQSTTSVDNGATVITAGSGSLSGAGNGLDLTTLSPVDNIWQGGITYNNQWDQVGLGLSATGEHGDSTAAGYHDLEAWALGAKLSYMGFSAAGSYGDWGKSLRAEGTSDSSNHYWTLGGAYEYGPYGLSVTYLDSKLGGIDSRASSVTTIGTDEFRNVVVGADYKLAPGLTPFAEVAFFDENAKGTGPTNDNTGEVFLLGTQLNF